MKVLNFKPIFSRKVFFSLILIVLSLSIISFARLHNSAISKANAVEQNNGEGDWVPDSVFGQKDFTQISMNEVVGNRPLRPEGITIDRNIQPNRLFINDGGNNRILGFSSLGSCAGGTKVGSACTNNLDCPTSTCTINQTKKADIIIGQPDEFSSACNGDSTKVMPATSSSICTRQDPRMLSPLESAEPSTFAIDSNHAVYFVDKWNQRVVKYNDPFSTDQIADYVWGQPSFTTRECNTGGSMNRSTLCLTPETSQTHISGDYTGSGVDVDPSGNVWVTDGGNHRVLRFPKNSKNADIVLGQSSFTTTVNTACTTDTNILNGVGRSKMCLTKAVRFDAQNNRVYVLDWADPSVLSRVLVFNAPFTNGMSPSEVILTSSDGSRPFTLTRPTAIEIDPFEANAIWITDANGNRLIQYKKIGTSWTQNKVIGSHSVSYSGDWGTAQCSDVTNPGPPWRCHLAPNGGIGIDSAGNIYAGNIMEYQVYRYSAPIPLATDLNGAILADDVYLLKNNAAGNNILEPNLIGSNGLAVASAVSFIESANTKQLVVADRQRILFWNNYDSVSLTKPADGVLYESDFASSHMKNLDTHTMVTDNQQRLWVARGSSLDVFQGPLQNSQQPLVTINRTLPLRFGGVISWSTISALAYDSLNDALWIADGGNYRIFRVKNPLDPNTRVVDIILGQPNNTTTTAHCASAGNSVIPDGFGNISSLRFDNFGNLYIVEAAHEGWSCSNNRVLEYDAVNLLPDPTQNFFAHGTRVPQRVYAKPNFIGTGSLPSSSPQIPINVAFTQDNKMILVVDGYGNPLGQRVFLYSNPLPVCSTPCSVSHDSVISFAAGHPHGIAFDSAGNVAIGDHGWQRVFYFKKPLLNQLISPTQTIIATPTIGTPVTATFTAVEDATTKSTSPTTNYGSDDFIRIRDINSPMQKGYVKFNVTGLTGSVTSAKLRLFAYDGSSKSSSAYITSSNWTESTINWNNAPVIGQKLSSVPSITNNTWVEYDVTAAVASNGIISFALANDSDNSINFRSSEYATNKPTLVITSGTSGGGPSPTSILPTQNVTPTEIPTPLPTSIATGGVEHQETITSTGLNTNQVTTSQITGGSNQFYVVAVGNRNNKLITSITGMGLNWTERKNQCAARNQQSASIWTAYGSPSSGTITVNFAQQTAAAVISVSRYSGVDGNNPVENPTGSNTLGQNGACTGGTDNNNAQLSLSSTVNGSVLFTFVNTRNKTVTISDPDYTQQSSAVAGSGGDLTQTYVYVRKLPLAGNDSSSHTLSGPSDWAMSGVVIRPQL